MATYKVLQDIEAEDKLIGPLTLRQFIYALAAALNGYLTFLVISKGAAFMAIVFLPLTLIPAFFAWPWSRDQPTEVWALAKIRFFVKPRRRIWNQSGTKELVTVTAPKLIEQVFTNGLSENEVKNRLKTLAGTIDSRGWAIKNVSGRSGMFATGASSDRLIEPSSLPQPVPSIDTRATEDMLDANSNPIAQQFDNMIAASTKAHRQNIMDRMQNPQQEPAQDNYWFLNDQAQSMSTSPSNAVTFNTQVVTPGSTPSDQPITAANPTPDEESLIKQLDSHPTFSPNAHGHLHVIQPLSEQKQMQAATPPQPTPKPPVARVTQQPDAAILDLARNDDLNVATLAREAQKRKDLTNEVVISLH